ncbi:MAG: hypothetical protein GC159_07150 [Phycisphaera sp.]|nr:hypothetical protein [Phycisphaera sp.]
MLKTCPNCQTRVVPMTDGICPSCRQPMAPSECAPSSAVSAGPAESVAAPPLPATEQPTGDATPAANGAPPAAPKRPTEDWPPALGIACPYVVLLVLELGLMAVGALDGPTVVGVFFAVSLFAGLISRRLSFREPAAAFPGLYHEETFASRFKQHAVAILIAAVLLIVYLVFFHKPDAEVSP